MLGSVDGAVEQINPVLALSGEYRLATMTEHMVTANALLRRRAFHRSAQAAALHAQITEFARHAAATIP